MRRTIRSLRARLTYANVVATLALIVAVGGGSAYAATTLAKNSVGTKQLRKNAVTSGKIKNGSLSTSDLSRRARTALRGTAGPQGPAGIAGPAGASEFAIVNSVGNTIAGTALTGFYGGPGVITVQMKRDVSACAYTATPAAVPGTDNPEPPAGSSATVASGGADKVVVKTYDAAGAPSPTGFHLIIACPAG